MGIFDLLSTLKKRFSPKPIDQWFYVTTDDTTVSFDVTPPGKEPWKDSFEWESVERICFKDEGLYSSDAYYVITSKRPGSYVVPAEANGGKEFVEKMLDLGKFDEKYFIEAMGSTTGGYYCWPKYKDDEQ